MFLLPAIASNYGVSATGIMWTNGVGGGLLMALGSLGGALVPGDWDRRLMYAVSGGMNGLAALVLMLANRPSVYFVGTALHLITNGFCYTWFTALTAEIVGPDAADASTLFSVLSSAATVALIYMIWLDGVGHRYFGTRGLLWTDAGASLLECAVVFAAFVTLDLGVRRAPDSQVVTHRLFTS
jgi:hypothetical protein